jgi:phage minor structural protein
MLAFYDIEGNMHPLVDIEDFCITHKLSGDDELSFTISTSHELYPLILEECRLEYSDNLWLIKKIQDDKVECRLNFDFLKTAVYSNYKSQTRTLSQVLDAILPSGWTVENANIVSISRTIEFDFCTYYDVIFQCMKTYGVYFVWHIKENRLTVYARESMQPTGEYVTDELNLRNLSFQGETTDYITRLYAYGKEGMTFSEINDGNEYIDDFRWSDKIVCGYWSDERYTVMENLLQDATKKLSELAYPVRSYECDVIDLSKVNDTYSFLDFSMHKVISLIDGSRGIKVEYQIIEYREYPDEPQRNVVTLSAVPGEITTSISKIESDTADEVGKSKDWLNYRAMLVTNMLLQGMGGFPYTDSNGSNYILDNPNPDAAQSVWIFNVNGMGHSSTGIGGPYSMAMTADNQFLADIITAMTIRGNLIQAGSIEAGAINQGYTDGVLTQSFEVAQGLVQSAISQINNYLTNTDGSGAIDLLQGTLSELIQNVNGITARFTDSYIGGVNFIRNSSGLNGMSNDWDYVGTVITQQSQETKNYTVSNSCFRLAAGATLTQVIDNALVNHDYTITLKAKKNSTTNAYFRLTYNGDSYVDLFNASSSFDWTEYTATIPNIQEGTLQIDAYSLNNYLYLSDIMLSEGTEQQGWTPAPNEIYTEEVKIDRHGIEVSNKGSNTRTVINNTEFAVYNDTEKVITVNKDETHLKKSIVDADLTIGNVKFLPLDVHSNGLNIILLD